MGTRIADPTSRLGGRLRRSSAIAIALLAIGAAATGLAPAVGAVGTPCPANAGYECGELTVSVIAPEGGGWAHSHEPGWVCSLFQLSATEAELECLPESGLQVICVAVVVHARVAGSGSISVAGWCQPNQPFAACTATTGLFGFGACHDEDVSAGLLPAKCKVTKAGTVAGDGFCHFVYAVF